MAKHYIAAFLIGSLATALPGCKDQSALDRAKAAGDIEAASAALSQLSQGPVQPGSDGFLARQRALQRLHTTVKGIRPDDKGLGAVGSLLTATVARELATLELASAADLEADLRRRRSVVGDSGKALRRLANLRDGQQSIDLEPSRQTMVQQRNIAEQLRQQYSQVMAELDGPIAKLSQEIEQDRVQVDQLSLAANTLRREAAELGHADGFMKFQEAVRQEREADKYENRIAHREVDLDYELRPEHKIAESQMNFANALIEAVDGATAGLERFQGTTDEVVATLDTTMSELSEQINLQLDEIGQLMTGENASLAGHYDRAIGLLGQAGSLASKAAGSLSDDDQASARIAAAQAYAAQGQALWSSAHDLSDHQSLLTILAGAQWNDQSLGAQLDAVGAQIDDLYQRALEAFEQAGSAADRLPPTAATKRLTASIQNVLQAISGTAPTAPGPSPAEPVDPVEPPAEAAEAPADEAAAETPETEKQP